MLRDDRVDPVPSLTTDVTSHKKIVTVFRYPISHHAEGLVNPKVREPKITDFLDTPEHVDSENIKLKICPRSYLDQLFTKRVSSETNINQ
jgi:hypothetical protein